MFYPKRQHKMCAVTMGALLVTVIILERSDAHSNSEDLSYDKIPVVTQKYPSLADIDIDPDFLAAHRRKLESDNQDVSKCEPRCARIEGQAKSCDEVMDYGYSCSQILGICPDRCENCYCTRTGESCTQKCSMRDTNIEGSYECGTWYRMDPKYTVEYLKDNAVVTGAEEQACTCDGCNGQSALSYCPNDTPYDASDAKANYMDIETAKNLGKIEKMRVTIVDDFVDLEKCKKNEFCAKYNCLEGDVGKKINLCEFNGYTKDCEVTCTAKDIMDERKSFILRRRFDWLKNFMADLLSLKPVQDPIELELTEKARPFIKELGKVKKSYKDTDLVVVLTMMKAYNEDVAGFATPLQRDNWDRTTVGWFNYVPDQIDASNRIYSQEKNEENLKPHQKADLLFQKSKDRRLILHEVLHLTGGIYSNPRYFVNKYGKKPCSHQIYVDEVEEWSGHRVRKLRTPKLLALARKQFGCSSLTGVPLEDHPVGKDNHWEARVFGPEIMSYGHNSGESYLSDLTLAYLEDTGHYVANYSNAGRLTPHSGEQVDLAKVPFLVSGETENDIFTSNRTALSPGYTRWGRHAGCAFVSGNPKNWPEGYRCNERNSGGCTQDNKMPGRCNLMDWGEGGRPAPTQIRCEPAATAEWGNYAPASSLAWKCKLSNEDNAHYPAIPKEYHYLGSGATGKQVLSGYSEAMDFVPHVRGAWNCQDQRPQKLSFANLATEHGSSEMNNTSFNEIFGDLLADSNNIGGQQFCPECRCFQSGLVPVADVLTTLTNQFNAYGLCYVSNCYSRDYLQVGIEGSLGLYWYRCPPEGGKLYIATFTGSLRCPVAKEFCRYETITGKLYGETNRLLEWVIFGTLGTAALIAIVLLVVFWKKINHKVHFCCGIDQDQENWDQILESRHGKHSTSGYILTVVGAIWAIAGAALVCFAIYSFITILPDIKPLWDGQTRLAPTMFSLGAFTLVVSIVGIEGAWRNHPTISLILYFYVCVFTLIICAVVPIVPFVLTDPLKYMVEDLWVRWKDVFPDDWQELDSAAAMERFETVTLPYYAPWIVFAGIVSIASVVAGIVCSILQLSIHVVVRNFEVVMNSMFFVISIVLTGYAIKCFLFLDAYIYVTAVIPASVLMIVGFIGILAACQKHETCFVVWQIAATVGFIVSIVTASILVAIALPPAPEDTVLTTVPSTQVTSDNLAAAATDRFVLMRIDPYIRSLDDDRIAEIRERIADPQSTSTYDLNMIIAWMTTYLRTYAIMLYACCVIELVLFVTNRLIIRWNEENDHPHGDHPHYLMCAVSVKKKRKRQKVSAAHVMGQLHRAHSRNKGTGKKAGLLRSVTMALNHTRAVVYASESPSLVPVVKVEVAMEKGVGLGMNLIASTHGPHKDEKCLAVNALKGRADGTPGPAEKGGMKVGDIVVTANGFPITDFASLKRALILGKSKNVTFELERKKTTESERKHSYDGHYPEIVLLHATRASPTERMGVTLHEVHEHGHSSYFDDNEETHIAVQTVSEGPMKLAGLQPHDVILSINDHNVASLPQFVSLVKDKTDMEFVVKRMTRSRNAEGRRENNIYTFDIATNVELDLGLNLKEITSGLGEKSSDSFLYVKDLRDLPNGDPGPGLVAGVRPYDLILKIDGVDIHTNADVKRAIKGKDMVQCEVRRMIRHLNEEKLEKISSPKHKRLYEEISFVVARPDGESLGLSLSEAYGGGSDNPFVIVTNVRSGSVGDVLGIKTRDIIWRVETKPVLHLQDLKEIVAGLNKFEITVRRENQQNQNKHRKR